MNKHANFVSMYNEGSISIVLTNFIYNFTIRRMAFGDFKKKVKKKFSENKEEYVVRACLEDEEALDACWKYELIGLRPENSEKIYIMADIKDWRDLIG